MRGLGSMLAIELVESAARSPPPTSPQGRRRALARAAAAQGGRDGNCIRVLVPLVISDAELDEALDVWEARARSRALGPHGRGRLSPRWSARFSPIATSSRSSSAPEECRASIRAHDRLLDRKVALKILHQQYSGDEDYVERFRREARSVAALSHPNIVTVIDRGEHGGPAVHRLRVRRGREPEAADRAARPVAGRDRARARRSRSRAGSRSRTSKASSTAT